MIHDRHTNCNKYDYASLYITWIHYMCQLPAFSRLPITVLRKHWVWHSTVCPCPLSVMALLIICHYC